MNTDHVFIDLAVTNPNPEVGQVIGIAAVRTNHKGKVLTAFSDKIYPDEFPLSEGESFDELEWKDAVSFHTVITALKADIVQPYSDSYVIVSVGDDDRKFLKVITKNRPEVFGKRRQWFDILQLAWPLCYTDMIPDRSFDSLCKHFNVRNSAPETATGEASALTEVYWAMMRRYRASLMGEEVVRQIGGDSLDKIRKWTGL